MDSWPFDGRLKFSDQPSTNEQVASQAVGNNEMRPRPINEPLTDMGFTTNHIRRGLILQGTIYFK